MTGTLTATTALPAARHCLWPPAPAATAYQVRCTHFRSPICHTADGAQDDSDYEEDEKAAAVAPQVPPPDHDDYYGKGWQPLKPSDQAERLADSAVGEAALCKSFT